jgi:hypothetical protein
MDLDMFNKIINVLFANALLSMISAGLLMICWNYSMTSIFNLPEITLLQA